MRQDLPASWRRRQWFWNGFLGLKYKGAKPAWIPVPEPQERLIKPIPLGQHYPSVPLKKPLVADHIPKDEAQPLKRFAVTMQNRLSRWYPPMQPGLPPIQDDPQAALLEAYPEKRHKLFPPPIVPEALQIDDHGLRLGRLAVEGPFACYLEEGPDGLQWDTLYLNDVRFELLPGLEPIGARVAFAPEGEALRAVRIETAEGVVGPGDLGFEAAAKRAMCGLSNDLSIVRHFSWVHLIIGGALSFAVRNALEADHPLRRLLWPHMFRTQYSNDMITEVQCDDAGDFVSMFSFTAPALWALLDDTHAAYNIVTLCPKRDAERRGLRGAGVALPSQDNLEALFEVFHTHTRRYLSAYYDDDAAIAADGQVTAWMTALAEIVPNGIDPITEGRVTIESVSELAAAMIYMGSVQHEVMGTNLWNYQLWTDVIPCRVYANGQREPVDVYQRLVNANLNLNINRAQLMRDFTYLALDDRGRSAFALFLTDLETLNAEMRAQPDAPWRIYPDILEANINA